MADPAVQSAMLSVQFHSLGREGTLGAPPSMLLPPDLEPLPLNDALDTIRDDGERVSDAAWTMLRGTPHPPFRRASGGNLLRYPRVLQDFCAAIDFDLKKFDRRRVDYRRVARLFAAALVAFAESEDRAFAELTTAVAAQDELGFGDAVTRTEALGSGSVYQFLTSLVEFDATEREHFIEALANLQDEVGVSLETYLGEFADTVAFIESRPPDEKPVKVFPAFTVTMQDTRTLTTMVTATALVKAQSFDLLTCAIDPRNWGRLSEAFRSVSYVDEALKPIDVGRIGKGHDPALLREDVRLRAHADGSEVGHFDNLLNVTMRVYSVAGDDGEPNDKKGWADLDFSLHRSIASRLLWDERPGGLVVDGGWTKLRCIRDGLWRVTSRKAIRFADRTPRSRRDSPLDFGQVLNFLAPSTLSRWLEDDIYGGRDDEVHDQALDAVEGAR